MWARRALFQIHLWSGIGAGIYLLVISVTGSVLVFRIELHKMFSRPPVTVTVSGERLTDDQLKEAANRAFPRYKVTNIWKQRRVEQAVEIWMERDEAAGSLHRIFDPYTGKNLGAPDPAMVRLIVWLASLHDDLLHGDRGRTANGVGAILLTVLCFTGLVIWWPGGDAVLQWLSRLHFGRFGGWPIKALWTVLGLIPLLLFITGALMWWNRVLRPRLQKANEEELEMEFSGVIGSSGRPSM